MADRNQADAVGKLFQSQVLDALSPELAEALTSPKVAQALADIDPAKLRGTDVARRIAAAIDPAKISFVTAELAKHFPSALNLYERLAKALTTNSQQQRSTADVTEAKPLSERGRVGLKRQAAIRQLLTEGWVPGDSRTCCPRQMPRLEGPQGG